VWREAISLLARLQPFGLEAEKSAMGRLADYWRTPRFCSD
jgi:hypothetical protein